MDQQTAETRSQRSVSSVFDNIEAEGLEIAGATSISSGPDNGFLDLAAGHFHRPTRHRTSRAAFGNLIENPTKARRVNLSGHGFDGFIETGMGQTGPADPQAYLTVWLLEPIADLLSRLGTRDFTIFSIYSCHTGAGSQGADFLFRLATLLNKPVRGRTGFTYASSEDISYEPNSLWQVALPGVRPVPIEAPSPHLFITDGNMIELIINDGRVQFDPDRIIKATVSHTPLQTQRSTILELDKDDASQLAVLCFASPGFRLPGLPSAMVTSTIEFQIESDSRDLGTIQLELLNNRMVRDVNSGYFYYTSISIGQYIRGL